MSLVHYTDIQALFSILEKREIWATNSKYLNDKDELLHFHELVISAINNQIKNSKLRKIYEKLFKRYFESINKNVFLLSFSLNSDIFNMWSHFSKNNGINLSINEERLFKNLGYYKHDGKLDHSSKFYCGLRGELINPKEKESKKSINCNVGELIHGKVIYDDKVKIKIVEDVYQEINDNPEMNSYKEEIMTELLIRNAYFFKKQGFSSENEYRIVFQLANLIDQNLISHRIKNNLIIPFIKIKFSPEELISEVKIGPWDNRIDMKDSIEEYFNHIAFNCEVKFSNLNIRSM